MPRKHWIQGCNKSKELKAAKYQGSIAWMDAKEAMDPRKQWSQRSNGSKEAMEAKKA